MIFFALDAKRWLSSKPNSLASGGAFLKRYRDEISIVMMPRFQVPQGPKGKRFEQKDVPEARRTCPRCFQIFWKKILKTLSTRERLSTMTFSTCLSALQSHKLSQRDWEKRSDGGRDIEPHGAVVVGFFLCFLHSCHQTCAILVSHVISNSDEFCAEKPDRKPY